VSRLHRLVPGRSGDAGVTAPPTGASAIRRFMVAASGRRHPNFDRDWWMA
jgi:hypothetical protein